MCRGCATATDPHPRPRAVRSKRIVGPAAFSPEVVARFLMNCGLALDMKNHYGGPR
jgi:hypothetical protein